MKKFLFSNCTIIEDGLFLVGIFGGLPAKMNFSDRRIIYYDTMDGFISSDKSTVVDFLDYYQNKVYALDSGEDHLVIWDIHSTKCQYVPLGCCHQPWINFVAFERYHSDYFIFPKYENKIIVFHTGNNKITEILDYLDGSEEVQCACREGDNVWILPKDKNFIYCYELKYGKKKIFDLKRMVHDCVHAVFYKDCIYILNMYGIIYQWNLKKAQLQEIVSVETVQNRKLLMGRIICAGNKLILLPSYGSDIKIVDLKTGKKEVYRNYPDDYDTQTTWWKYYGYCEDELYYYFAVSAGNYLLKIEKQSGKLMWMKPKIDYLGGDTIDFLKKRNLYESDYWELADLMQAKLINTYCGNMTYIGNKIYRTIKDV